MRYTGAMQIYLFSGGGDGIMPVMAERAAAALAGRPRGTIAYIPAASVRPPDYWRDLWAGAFAAVGDLRTIDLDTTDAPAFAVALAGCAAMLVPGGNTYLLSRRMHRYGAMRTLADAVRAGTPLITRSAGTVFCGPNMLTTNDWNVFGTTEFDGLALSPYNFNVHFTLPPPEESESRDFRIREYIAVNARPVLALEETCNLEWGDAEVRVHGATAWLYTTAGERRPLAPGATFRAALGG
jgi:peptidase E